MWSDNETTTDLLGYKVHADLIKEIVTDSQLLPITIGIFGDWGSGKSSLMKMLENDLTENNKNTIVLFFNGWLFEGYDDAKAALIDSILNKLSEDSKIKDKIGEKATELLKSVNWMRLAGFGFKNLALPLLSGYLSGGATLVPFIINKLNEYKENPDKLTELIKHGKTSEIFKDFIKRDSDLEAKTQLVREFRIKFEELIQVSRIDSLIVMIDDLDRCSPERIIENLEAIKLFLNVSKTAFIIGADRRIVSNAIKIRYKELYDVNDIESSEKLINDYLEKLIQIPYELPKLSDSEVETYITLLLCQKELELEEFDTILSEFNKVRKEDRYSVFGLGNIKSISDIKLKTDLENQIKAIARISEVITEGLKGNPRQIKRFLNKYLIRKKLASVAKIKTIKDEILTKLMVLEYSHWNRFEELNNWQAIQKGQPKEIKELERIVKGTKPKDKNFDSFKNWNNPSIINWLKTPPYLSDVDLRDYFWISRDKLSDTIKGSSLISPYVRELFEKIKNYPSDYVLDKIIKEEVKKLMPNEFNTLFDLLCRNLLDDSENERNYTICNLLVKEFRSKIKPYNDILNKIEDEKIPPAAYYGLEELAIEFKEIKSFLKKQQQKKTEFGKTVQKYFKET